MKAPYPLLLLALTMLAGCGSGNEPAARDPELAQTSGEAQRDFDTLDVCELISADTVAAALGGTSSREPVSTTVAGLGTQCLYSITIGGDNIDARIGLSSPDFWYRDDEDRALEGLGDEAYATETDIGVNGTVHDINVLVAGDAEVNVTSNTFERAEILAKLALEHL